MAYKIHFFKIGRLRRLEFSCLRLQKTLTVQKALGRFGKKIRISNPAVKKRKK